MNGTDMVWEKSQSGMKRKEQYRGETPVVTLTNIKQEKEWVQMKGGSSTEQ